MGDRLFLLGKNAGNDLTDEDDMVIINDKDGKELLRVHNPDLSEVLRGAFLDMSDEIEELKEFIISKSYCPDAYGFDGPDTFFGCGRCVCCKLKEQEG